MRISAREAAELVGVSKQAICRACKDGKVSATRGLRKEWIIDIAELERVYNYKPSTIVKTDTIVDDGASTHQTDLLAQRVEMLERMLRDKDDTIHDLRTRLDVEAEERRHTQLLLEDKQKPRPNWWQRLRQLT